MAVRPVQVNIKAVDHVAVGRFWADALGWTARSGHTTYVGPPGDLVWPDPLVLGIDVVPVPDRGPAGKNRVHLDLATRSATHQRELVERLRDLGATPADVGQGADVPWTVLADPEGNEFCVLDPRDEHGDTGPIAVVVVDCADPRALARFWAAAIDWPRTDLSDGHAEFRAGGPYLEFLRSAAPPERTGRIHLDLLPSAGGDPAAEVTRLRALGATDVDLGQGDVPWTVLADPEGTEFCVLAP